MKYMRHKGRIKYAFSVLLKDSVKAEKELLAIENECKDKLLKLMSKYRAK